MIRVEVGPNFLGSIGKYLARPRDGRAERVKRFVSDEVGSRFDHIVPPLKIGSGQFAGSIGPHRCKHRG